MSNIQCEQQVMTLLLEQTNWELLSLVKLSAFYFFCSLRERKQNDEYSGYFETLPPARCQISTFQRSLSVYQFANAFEATAPSEQGKNDALEQEILVQLSYVEIQARGQRW